MTGAADWVIVAVIVVSVIQAAISGFFHEAFGIAGLIFGYLLAAWNYERLAARYAPFWESVWWGETAVFLFFFWGVLVLAGTGGGTPRHIVREVGLSFVDRILGGA